MVTIKKKINKVKRERERETDRERERAVSIATQLTSSDNNADCIEQNSKEYKKKKPKKTYD